MRLPLKSADPGDIDLPQTTQMIRLAVDNGVNYIDTAYGYHNGKSETAVGQALRDGYREKVQAGHQTALLGGQYSGGYGPNIRRTTG